jgi:hypothetical protein
MQTKELYVQRKKLISVKAFSLTPQFIILLFVLATVDPCSNYQCNQGACQKDRGTQPYCSCYEGYGGSRCETQIGMSQKSMHV